MRKRQEVGSQEKGVGRGERRKPVEAARALVERDFDHCLAAFLAGSVVREEATASSDLDILIVVPDGSPTYRESSFAFGWPVECFVQTIAGHRHFAAHDAARRRPSTSMMACEGIIVRNRGGLATRLKQEACALLEAGPPPLSEAEVAAARYGLTDLLDDFEDATSSPEALFIAAELAVAAADLILDHHRRWRGRGKWLLRALARLDPELAARLADAADRFYRNGDPASLIGFADDALALVGGRLWAGYRVPVARNQEDA